MKTTRKRRELPQPIRLIFLIIGIAAVCLPNWIAIRAGTPISDPPDINFKKVFKQEEETEHEIAKWNKEVKIDDLLLIADFEPEIKLEDWMLDVNWNNQMAEFSGECHKSVPFNLKPYTREWFEDFKTFGTEDVRIGF